MNKNILIVEDEFIVANDLACFLKNQNYNIIGIASSVNEALQLIDKQMPYMVLLDIHLKGKLTGIDLAKKLQVMGIPFIYLSAYSNKTILDEAKATKPYGFLVKPFREKDLLITLEIASYHVEHNLNFNSQLEQQLIEKLNRIPKHPKWEDTFTEIAKAFQTNIPFDYLQMGLKGDHINLSLGFNRIGLQDYQIIGLQEFSNISREDITTLKKIQAEGMFEDVSEIFNNAQFEELQVKYPFEKLIANCFQAQSSMFVSFDFGENLKLNLSFYNRKNEVFLRTQLDVIQKFSTIFIKILSPLLESETQNIETTIQPKIPITSTEQYIGFKKIIGNSFQLLNIFDDIKRVAPMTTSVLIMGESGTGKELFAKSIHEFSPRSNKPFVVINCGAIPENLIESTLFGHDKGAFTGATETRIGKFEQANGGTIFLDEIGEMPLEMQVKLLRVLQEKEIERIGTNKTISIDVRVIAATNKNLEEAVEAGKFRLDLYYRLHVFPINTPSLRDRKDDIPVLVDYFIAKFSNVKMDVSHFVLQKMIDYSWPGNIRELENYIERSVLLAKGSTINELHKPLNTINIKNSNSASNELKPLADMERDYILSVLKLCKGKVYGEGGASEILKIPTSTLNSKIKKLGIKKGDIY
ncbi:sigma 54-interacting response regulator [Mariniflexile litorale]|uniref:Sigma 54-interacting response regulator n=1 Tax=Mariniflexile litorale TaxID=3045158 RepID=A0AAU7EFV7_9FLAO|nr:sigma 54-interacting response regulator [Mariniflexile sp. KMM 9835]MDQ8211991.1 sigma 54-interacting response regulator [Mariniflexile sp. KMM 9835]